MDELVQEKLNAMGITKPSKSLVNLLIEWKRRQDAIRPAPLSLDAIVCCTLIHDVATKLNKRGEQKGEEKNEQEG